MIDNWSPIKQNKSLKTQWKPGKSIWKYQTKKEASPFTSIIHTKRQNENDIKPIHKQVLGLSNELDKCLGQKHHKQEMNLFNETMVGPWNGSDEHLSKYNTLYQRRNWTIKSKLQPLSYQPRANFNERFTNNKLSVLGSKSNLGERNNMIPFKDPRNAEVEAGKNGNVSSSLNHSQWSEAFSKARVRRLNEVS